MNEKSIDKRTIFFNLLISLIITLILTVITPLDIIFVNINDFSASLSEMISCLILPCVITFVAICVILSVFSFINSNICEIIKILFTSIIIAFYVQELFLNGKMVRSDDGSTIGDIPYFEESLNFIINFFIIFFPSVIAGYCLFNTCEKNNESNSLIKIINLCIEKKWSVLLLVCIVVMKTSGLVSDYIVNAPQKYEQNDSADFRVFSFDSTVSFSKEQNICVFVIDMFDGLWCDEFLELYPEVQNELEGFTFYKNNISPYTNTFPSMTYMFTKCKYDKSSWYDYFYKAWNEKNVFSVLKENDYKINLILEDKSTYGNSRYISSFCDNAVIPENLERTLYKDKLRDIIFKMTFLRMVPYSFKVFFESVVFDVSEQAYIEYKTDNIEKMHTGTVSTTSDCQLFDYIERAKFNANSDKKVLTVIHLHGAHDTNDVLINKIECSNAKGDKFYMTLRANFETVLKYIRASKDLDVYDDTSFIILGDHARTPDRYYDINNNNCLTEPLVTALLIKPAHSYNSNFTTDDDSELSNSMLAASILEYAGVDHSIFGDSYNDVITNHREVSREFHTYIWHGYGKVRSLHDYVIRGNARDFSNWEMVN